MPRHFEEEEEWGEDDSGWDADDEEYDPDEEEPFVPCPYCNRQVHEDAQRCPYCERYISEEDSPPTRKPWWIAVGTLFCLVIIYCWIFR